MLGKKSRATELVFNEGTVYTEAVMFLSETGTPRSARIVATSKKLTCSATVLERQGANEVPGASWSLPVIKKTKQQGA